ncbi:hypothetical protein FDP41_007863 [Naegleria fowleri]|uniref:Uncharacterized protein n=1 Tax=Naegleria fowleri TaxID=5763 RepID=A0A6A5CEN4_NAEFO|nr:uncharacterized protein FDP41_007863 [Naegleria fowleri]KAF0983948.1 hypothetical protein FDP41_007863 [Naegleria fowleri]
MSSIPSSCNDSSPTLQNGSKTRDFAIVFDIDGVLIHDGTVIEGAPEILKSLYSHHIPYVLLTNGGGESEESRAQRLSKLFGVEIDASRIILSHTPLNRKSGKGMFNTEYHQKILHIGRNDEEIDRILDNYGYTNRISLTQFADQYPFLLPYSRKDHENYYKFSHEEQLEMSTKDEPIDTIILVDTPVDWLESLQVCCDLILSDGRVGHLLDYSKEGTEQKVKVKVCNPDLVYQGVACRPRFTMGAFIESLDALFYNMNGKQQHLKCEYFGKPCKVTYDYAKNVLIEQFKSYHSGHEDRNSVDDLTIYAIGDNPLSDIKGMF